MNELSEFLDNKYAWSLTTFGLGKRTVGNARHIMKELTEIVSEPDDQFEWIDVILIAIDGYMRCGGRSDRLLPDLEIKHFLNTKRAYPFPKTESEVPEHIREGE